MVAGAAGESAMPGQARPGGPLEGGTAGADEVVADVTAALLVAIGRGKRELLVPTADGVAEPRNRRVEIVVR